jgi:hypothetical protein
MEEERPLFHWDGLKKTSFGLLLPVLTMHGETEIWFAPASL